VLALDAVDREPAREAIEGAGELDRLGEAEGVRRALRQRRGDRLGERVEPVDRARRRARADGVDDDHRVGARPLLDQPHRLALVRADTRGNLVE
jgi:hypothetical protein